MKTKIIIYEDFAWPRLLPLVYMRAVCDLVCGSRTLLARVQSLIAKDGGRESVGQGGADSSVSLWCRPAIAPVVAERSLLETNVDVADEPCLFLNGRGFWQSIPSTTAGERPWVGMCGDDVACLFADAELAKQLGPKVFLDEAQLQAAIAGLPQRDVSSHVQLISRPWELVSLNETALRGDWETDLAAVAKHHVQPDQGSYLLNPDHVHLGAGTRIKPCVVIDAEDGPVWIGDNVTIMPHSYIQGPTYIGDGCLIQPSAVVHEGTTIGPVCKIGGEIEASIVHGFSNKQHDGFLGHSYIGTWVNIAADCVNSDLKNTYGTVRVPINGRDVETGEMFVGMFVGDYSKAGINVSFPTGSVIGFCSSVFAPQSPKFVPSFAWINNDDVQRYDSERGLEIARKVMLRRKKIMSPAEEAVFSNVRKQALALEHQSQRMLEDQG